VRFSLLDTYNIIYFDYISSLNYIKDKACKKVDFCKVFDDFICQVSPGVSKIEKLFLLQLIENKEKGGFCIPIIDLGKFKEFTAVFKL